MGYSPSIWGPQAWHFIHMVALSYPLEPNDEMKEKYFNFFKSLCYTLPCPTCSRHYEENFKSNPPRLNSRKELFNWTVDLHNKVNKSNNKPELSYDDAFKEVVKNTKKPFPYMLYGAALSISLITVISLWALNRKK
jgi:hypothetical protein